MSEKRKNMLIRQVAIIPSEQRYFPGVKKYWDERKHKVSKEQFLEEANKHISNRKMIQLRFYIEEDKTLEDFLNFANKHKKYPPDILLEEAFDYLNDDDHKKLLLLLSNK